jgi:hypothetical protein
MRNRAGEDVNEQDSTSGEELVDRAFSDRMVSI